MIPGDSPLTSVSDAPMPADAMDQISLHSAKSPAGASGGGLQYGHPLESRPSKSHLKVGRVVLLT